MEVPSDALWRVSTRVNKPESDMAAAIERTLLAPDAHRFGQRPACLSRPVPSD
jgi:hypothetical protein